jgi:hypothetical protein
MSLFFLQRQLSLCPCDFLYTSNWAKHNLWLRPIYFKSFVTVFLGISEVLKFFFNLSY